MKSFTESKVYVNFNTFRKCGEKDSFVTRVHTLRIFANQEMKVRIGSRWLKVEPNGNIPALRKYGNEGKVVRNENSFCL